jgi:O-succinylbenzoate synthase
LKIANLEVAKFRIPLRKPYRVGDVVSAHRTGRLVRITGDDGHVGYGEVTPLPGLHAESLEDADRVLLDVGRGIVGRVFQGFEALAHRVADRVAAHGTDGEIFHPSVCFGLQTAAMGLFARAEGLVAAQVLSSNVRMEVPVCGFFSGNPPDADDAIAAGTLDAYPCVKVKIGRLAPTIERRTIDTLLQGLPPHVKLRLDANRGLTLEQALELFHDLPLGRIEYLEEPLADPSEMAALHRQTRLPMAIDESLHDPTVGYLQRAPFVTAWIVKPAREGDWRRVRDLAEEAGHRFAGCVISSCLETGVGLWALAQMAAAIPGKPLAAGLATNILLGADMLKPRFDATSGSVETVGWQDTPTPHILGQLKFKSLAG